MFLLCVYEHGRPCDSDVHRRVVSDWSGRQHLILDALLFGTPRSVYDRAKTASTLQCSQGGDFGCQRRSGAWHTVWPSAYIYMYIIRVYWYVYIHIYLYIDIDICVYVFAPALCSLFQCLLLLCPAIS